MKKITVLILLLAIFVAPRLFSQSAVYFCTSTGAFGYAYGYGDYSKTLDEAYNSCISYGGTNPQLISSTENKGYGSIALGTDGNGNRIIGAALGFSTSAGAEKEAKRVCSEYGGQNVYIHDTWNDY